MDQETEKRLREIGEQHRVAAPLLERAYRESCATFSDEEMAALSALTKELDRLFGHLLQLVSDDDADGQAAGGPTA